MLAHRYAWFLKYGREPSETLDHTCYVRHCVNPDHMIERTLEENQREGLKRRRFERMAFEWLLSQWDYDHEALQEFFTSTECDKLLGDRGVESISGGEWRNGSALQTADEVEVQFLAPR